MNILLVVPWDGEPGGVVAVTDSLAVSLQQAGHEVFFFHPDPAVLLKTSRKANGFWAGRLRLSYPFKQPRVVVSGLGFPLLFPVVLPQLLWFLVRHRIQVINVHYPIDNFFYFGICRRLLGIRLVTSIHGADAFKHGQPKKKFSRAFKFLVQMSDVVVLPSRTYRERIVKAVPAIAAKTIFIHNSVDPSRFCLPANAGRIHGPDRYILCIGHLQRWKAVDVLLHAAQPLMAKDPALRLVLAGDGPQREELENLAASLGIRSRVDFLGMRPAEEIPDLIHGCELLALASREESFGIVVVEAMAAQKPVVATAVGGIPEIVEHEQTGILVEPDDPFALTQAMNRVLTDKELARHFGENGRQRVMDHFSTASTAAAYECAFRAV